MHFGANAATDVTVFSHHLVTAKSPAGTGTVDVTVTTPLGTSAVTRKDEFTLQHQDAPGRHPRHAPPWFAQRRDGGHHPAGPTLTGATAVDFGTNAATGV